MTMYSSTVSRALQRLHDEQARIPQSQISAGAKSHQYIADVLKNRRRRDPNFPWVIETMLSGSYIRKTKPAPLDDIDMLVILDGNGLVEYSGGILTGGLVRGVEPGSPVLGIKDAFEFICSSRLLDRFRRAIAETYPSSKVRKDGQAINIRFGSGIGLDVVPCFEIIPTGGLREYFYIPAGQAGGWISTNPRMDREYSDALNTYHNNFLRPTVRLVKLWNNEQNAGRLQSYHIEVLVWRAFGTQAPVIDLEDGLDRFFNFGPASVLAECADPTGIGGPIDTYLGAEARWASYQALENVRKKLPPRLLFGSVDLAAWERIFNRQLERAAI